jgi:putative ABC transport system substrate-binding protein
LYGKHLELLREAVPSVRRVAVLANPANPNHVRARSNVKAAARSLGLRLQLLEARGPDEFDGAFAAMAQDRAEALLVVSDSLFTLHRARLADLVVKNRLPSMHGVMEQVEAGGLMSYGARLLDLWRRAATYVDKILRGARPADLPIEQPTKFDLAINLKTAKALGLTIPPTLLQRADAVIR